MQQQQYPSYFQNFGHTVLTNLNWVNYEYPVPDELHDVDPWNLAYPVSTNWHTSPKRMLIVLDNVPKEDLKNKNLLSGSWQRGFRNLIHYAGLIAYRWHEYYNRSDPNQKGINFKKIGKESLAIDFNEWAFAFVSINYFRTYDLPDHQKITANNASNRRIKQLIADWKPTHIHAMGNRSAKALGYDKSNIGRVYETPEGLKYSCNINPVQIDYIDNPDLFHQKVDISNLSGYIAHNLARILIDTDYPLSLAHIRPKVTNVNSMTMWKEFYTKLCQAKVVAVDVETYNLTITDNGILTIQFAFDEFSSYFIALRHKDRRWTTEEYKIICEDLRAYFANDQIPRDSWDTPILVGHHFEFDLKVICEEFGINTLYHRIWDTESAEFILDENQKSVFLVGINNHFQLKSIAAKYENDFLETSKFKKSQRTIIADVPIDENLVFYGGMDAQLPMGFMRVQREQAAMLKCDKGEWLPFYDKLVTGIYSDTWHVIGEMLRHGTQADRSYLEKQYDLSRSDVVKEKESLLKELNGMPSMQKTNEIIVRDKDKQTRRNIFGSPRNKVNIMSKNEHQQVLFFDVLGLESNETEKGHKQVNKEFFQRYNDETSDNYVREVDLYQKIKEFNTCMQFIKQYIDKINETDGRYDDRIRSDYGVFILTGRTSSSKPCRHQVPQHRSFAKIIKRFMVSNEDSIIVKMDEATFEMRVWGMVSKDQTLLSTFNDIEEAKHNYINNPTEENRLIFENRDFHKLNYSKFAQIPLEEVTKKQRQYAKNIGFGTVYGMSIVTLANQMGVTEAEMQPVVDSFFNQFKAAGDWLEEAVAVARFRLYMCNPIQFRRNLYGYLLEQRDINNALDRRAKNSPIQGYASQLNFVSARNVMLQADQYFKANGEIEAVWNDEYQKFVLYKPNFHICALIHDSIECEIPIKDVHSLVKIMNECGTNGLLKYVAKMYDYQTPVPLMVDFEMGDSGDKMEKWDFTRDNFQNILLTSMENKNIRLGKTIEDNHGGNSPS